MTANSIYLFPEYHDAYVRVLDALRGEGYELNIKETGVCWLHRDLSLQDGSEIGRLTLVSFSDNLLSLDIVAVAGQRDLDISVDRLTRVYLVNTIDELVHKMVRLVVEKLADLGVKPNVIDRETCAVFIEALTTIARHIPEGVTAIALENLTYIGCTWYMPHSDPHTAGGGELRSITVFVNSNLRCLEARASTDADTNGHGLEQPHTYYMVRGVSVPTTEVPELTNLEHGVTAFIAMWVPQLVDTLADYICETLGVKRENPNRRTMV